MNESKLHTYCNVKAARTSKIDTILKRYTKAYFLEHFFEVEKVTISNEHEWKINC